MYKLLARRYERLEHYIRGYLVSDGLGNVVGWCKDATSIGGHHRHPLSDEREKFPTLIECLEELDVWFDGSTGVPPREFMPVCRVAPESYKGTADFPRVRRPNYPPPMHGLGRITADYREHELSFALCTTAGVRVYGIDQVKDGAASSFTCVATPQRSLSMEELHSRIAHGEPFAADAWCPSYRGKDGSVRYGRAWLEVTTL